MKPSANDPCPCGRPAKLKRCCAAIHRGRPAPDPETLMRARFTAYAVANVRFIVETTHPSAPHFRDDQSAWRTELLALCRATRFVRLTVHSTELAEPPEPSFVTFTAELLSEGSPAELNERSRFERIGTRWKYVCAEDG